MVVSVFREVEDLFSPSLKVVRQLRLKLVKPSTRHGCYSLKLWLKQADLLLAKLLQPTWALAQEVELDLFRQDLPGGRGDTLSRP